MASSLSPEVLANRSRLGIRRFLTTKSPNKHLQQSASLCDQRSRPRQKKRQVQSQTPGCFGGCCAARSRQAPRPPLPFSTRMGHGHGHHSSSANSRLQALKNHIGQRHQSSVSSSSREEEASEASASSSDPPPPRCIDFEPLARLMPSSRGPAKNNDDDNSVWYVVATAALMAYHQEVQVGRLWNYISEHWSRDEKQLVNAARRVRETCLKASVLVGFPRGINSLLALQSAIASQSPNVHAIISADQSLRAPVRPDEKYERGRHFFSQIYAGHTDRILQSMSSSSGGDLSHFALTSVYGELMAEMRILNPMETVMLEFVCCLADDVAPQAKGHFFGCHNLGATGRQVDGAVAIVQSIAKQLGRPHPGNGKRYEFLKKTNEW